MNRLLMIGSLTALLVGSTGCLHHNTRSGCNSCSTGACGSGNCMGGTECSGCNTCQAGPYAYGDGGRCVGDGCNGGCGSGLLGRIGGMCGLCGNAGCRPGCIPGRLGWQQGGHDYSAHLQPGCCGHHAGDGACGAAGCNGACGGAGCMGNGSGANGGFLNAGPLGHNAGNALNSRPFTAGPPTATVAYPYYTHRGPRDFLLDNPPSIGY